MDCPKCVGLLKKKLMEDIEVDSCPVCEGIWFDAGELEEIIKRDSHDFDYIDVGREEFDGKELSDLKKELDSGSGKCPRCEDATMLVRREYKGKHKINVDICPKGHGLWLDGGEIEELRKRGLVNLKDRIDFELELVRFAFSKEGFKAFIRRVTGR
jgi:Zn-finger nucleic acid-binding protein